MNNPLSLGFSFIDEPSKNFLNKLHFDVLETKILDFKMSALSPKNKMFGLVKILCEMPDFDWKVYPSNESESKVWSGTIKSTNSPSFTFDIDDKNIDYFVIITPHEPLKSSNDEETRHYKSMDSYTTDNLNESNDKVIKPLFKIFYTSKILEKIDVVTSKKLEKDREITRCKDDNELDELIKELDKGTDREIKLKMDYPEIPKFDIGVPREFKFKMDYPEILHFNQLPRKLIINDSRENSPKL